MTDALLGLKNSFVYDETSIEHINKSIKNLTIMSQRKKSYSLNISVPSSPIAKFSSFRDNSKCSSDTTASQWKQTSGSFHGIGLGTPTNQLRQSHTTSQRESPMFNISSVRKNIPFDVLTDSTNIKLLLIGDAGIGKTAMILSYSNEFPTMSQLSALPKENKKLDKMKTIEKRKRYSLNDYEELFSQDRGINSEKQDELVIDTKTTIGIDIKSKLVNIDNRFFKVIMWDTAGQERYRNAMIPSLYKGSHGILLSYDICNFESFENCLNHWLLEAVRNINDIRRTRFYLIGNKIDIYKEREVNHDDVLNFINKIKSEYGINISGNFEVSCKWQNVVERTFNIVIKDLVEHGCYEDDKEFMVFKDKDERKEDQSNRFTVYNREKGIEMSDGKSSTMIHRQRHEQLHNEFYNKRTNTIDITNPLNNNIDSRSSCCM